MNDVLSGLPLSIITPADIGIVTEPVEHGETYQDNAILKATHYAGIAHMPTLADDSGIIVDALHNELGVHTRRWGAGPKATDQEWIDFFLKRMHKESNRQARFVCCLAYIDTAGTTHIFEGVCNGVITLTLEAAYLPGLPISACFRPEGHDRVYSAMSVEQKNAVSHRGQALQKFLAFLTHELSTENCSVLVV